MTFLRWQIDEIYKGNDSSKMLIMSHDLMTIFDIQKVYNDIADKDYAILELKNNATTNRGLFKKERNEYKRIIDDVFDLVNNNVSNSDFLSIGNKMRRMEEAYSSFIGNKQFEKMLHDDDFLKRVPEEKRAFFKNFMCRLILNTESHSEEKSYDMNAFSAMYNEQEIRETAKYLLLLFYYVDPYHLKSYLGNDKFGIVSQWE